jgi:anaerobic glycerol-3-phosphate dehydrogenase
VPDADDILIIGGGLAGRTSVVALEKGGAMGPCASAADWATPRV